MFNPIVWALRRPVTVITLAVALLLLGVEGGRRMRVDIFPNLNLPVIYVCQPYGGMDPSQMEGLLTNYYEYHFLYINGIHHVESRNVQGLALMKLYFHPETDMASAMAETLGYVTRARAFMPPGTVSPFVTRFDAGSIPVGYLVLSSETRTISEIQDQALFKVRPMFSGLPGVSAPPPFGGSQRTIVVRLDPDRLKSYRMAPDEVIQALNTGNAISPSGTVRFGDSLPIVPVNALARDLDDLRHIPIRPGHLPTVHLGDVAAVVDAADIPVGSALVDGRKAVYLLVTKRADASTLDVIRNVRNALPDMQAVLPDDIKVALEFDQSPTVTSAINAVTSEALLGALLVGLMVLLFLRDWRSMLIVIINIPLALAGAVTLLWLSGQSFNLMTLGGLALAIGILVDESTVEIENIHVQMRSTPNVATAVRRGNRETAVPRLLALLCMLAVFAPSFLMSGAVRALFVPLSLSVGFAMITSYLLSSTLVPVLAALLLKPHAHHDVEASSHTSTTSQTSRRPLSLAFLVAYITVCAVGIVRLAPKAGFEIFPRVDSGRFQVRIKAPAGTRYEVTEKITADVVQAVEQIVGPEGVEVSVGYVGNIASSYPIQAIFQWTGGPEEAFLRIALDPGKSRLGVEETKTALRDELARLYPDVSFSLEPADVVSEVMSFGSPTPVEVVVTGTALPDVRAHAEKIRAQLANLPTLRDLRYGQTLDYPALRVEIDRRRAGLSGVTAADVARSLVTATSSSRFILPSYWPDPKSGIGYQVQVEIPYQAINNIEDLENLPLSIGSGASPMVLRDVASVRPEMVPGEFDRYNMKRTVTLTANVTGRDLSVVQKGVQAAVDAAGKPPTGVTVSVRGQLATLDEINISGRWALLATLIVILLLLTAYYQSIGLALVSLVSVPSVGLGMTLMLLLTNTTWNLQSYMGAIMALGVSVANAILLVSFAESERLAGKSATDAANHALSRRIRPILMTALTMIAGMIPMAAGLTESGSQQAPLGRAVIGGLLGSLIAVIFITPRAFSLLRGNASSQSRSLDPTDPESRFFDESADRPGWLKTVRHPVSVMLFIAISLLSNNCQTVNGQHGTTSGPKPRVTVTQAAPTVIQRRFEQPGQVEPAMVAPLESRISGWIGKVNVDIGDKVKKGQVLIEIDAPEIDANLIVGKTNRDQAAAEVLLAKALYEEAQQIVAADQARLQAAEAELKGEQALEQRAELELDRMKRLAASGAVTTSNIDEAQQHLLSAKAEVNKAQALIIAERGDMLTARAQLARRLAEVKVAEARLEVAKAKSNESITHAALRSITAPFDGIVVERHADPGQLVSDTAREKPILVLHKIDTLTVSVGVPETEAELVNIGDPVEILTSQDSTNPACKATITRTSWAFDPTTRTLRTEIDIDPKQSSLRPGQYVLVRVTSYQDESSVTLPMNAVYKQNGASFCTVVQGGMAQKRPVTNGVTDGTRVTISKGLTAGETVVQGPAAATLADNQPVDVIPADPAKK